MESTQWCASSVNGSLDGPVELDDYPNGVVHGTSMFKSKSMDKRLAQRLQGKASVHHDGCSLQQFVRVLALHLRTISTTRTSWMFPDYAGDFNKPPPSYLSL